MTTIRNKFVETAVGRMRKYPDMKICVGCGQNFAKTEGFYNCRTCGMKMCEMCCSEHSDDPETCAYQKKRVSEIRGLGEMGMRHNDTAKNTDRELWRERDDYYADSIHVTEGGGIGINCGGTVHVMPLRMWHQLAEADRLASQAEALAQFTKGLQVPLSNPAIYWWTCRLCGTATAGEEAPQSHVCENPNQCSAAEAPTPTHYEKVPQENCKATQLYMIVCRESWRESIVCSDMYEWAADWLVEQIQGRPYAPGKH